MIRNLFYSIFLLSISITYSQNIEDNFEGNSTSLNWFGDNCGVDVNFLNPFQTGINTSSKVLKYTDNGGQYANVGFNTSSNFYLYYNSVFTVKIYVPSNGLTGNQPNQISLKLQNGNLTEPWTTQTEIIKPLVLNQWQTITFNFANDPYINYNVNSVKPIYRQDFNRVLLQINGENNTDFVTAYIDDFFYYNSNPVVEPVFDNLVWSDEFNGNGAINTQNWFHQTQLPNGVSWYNGEIQHYTNRVQNSNLANGNLNIVAIREQYTNQGQTKSFTSARLNSKFAFKYGRVEVRAKLPSGVGTWPAIWMLGKNTNEPGGFWASSFGTVNWPASGEIDIMEHWGNDQNFVQSAMHTPSSSGNTVNKGGQVIPTVSSQFHVYSLDWSSEKMVFKVDNVIHYIYNPTVKNSSTWPFNAEQYILLNFAIQQNINSGFIQGTFEIDYVRVFQESPLSDNYFTTSDKIILFPNPAAENLTLSIPKYLVGKKASLYSIVGQNLKTFTINEVAFTLDVSSLKKGIYFIQISGEKENLTTKFIKN